MIGAVPGQGGATWAVLQYLLGLKRLGYDVYFLEEVDPALLRPAGVPIERSENASYVEHVMQEADLSGRWTLVDRSTGRLAGPAGPAIGTGLAASDVLINLAGNLRATGVADRAGTRVYVDLDPGFTQVWHSTGWDVGLDGHTHYATVGRTMGQAGCKVPNAGRDWIRTFPPVVIDEWPVQAGPGTAITTVANWRSYGSVEVKGQQWGQKAHSWRSLVDLPRRTSEHLEAALVITDGDHVDRDALVAGGWVLRDPEVVAGSPANYRRYIQSSKAELAVAKSGYVLSRSGWMSDRSVCYLASGRPVVAQDTGFDVPTGEGLIGWSTEDEAVAGLEQVGTDYARHSAAARSLAVEVFDSDLVLGRLMESVK
jgi:hypothetical protein